MPEKPLKKPGPESEPTRRTLSNAEIAVGQCAGATRDQLDELLESEGTLPSLSANLGIEEELQNAFEQSSKDSFELAKAKEAFKKEELEATRIEIADLEEKILDAANEFKELFQKIKEISAKFAESKKVSRKANVGPQDHLEAINNVKMAKDAVRRLDQLKLEFEMWTKRLQSINRRSKVLKNQEVIRLVVQFQKMDKVIRR